MSDADHSPTDGSQPGIVGLIVRDDPDHERFDLWLGDELVGILGYCASTNGTGDCGCETGDAAQPTGSGDSPRGVELSLMHTVVKEEFGGRGFAAALVSRALDEIRDRGLRVRPICTYVQLFLSRYPQYDDLVAG
ncbi:MAG: N-acetyltransferase [Rhodococcus sp.]|nr:N-acetyltransferase [Rhodococcus sp. (in: high G+C Gram-positive bacteria)]